MTRRIIVSKHFEESLQVKIKRGDIQRSYRPTFQSACRMEHICDKWLRNDDNHAFTMLSNDMMSLFIEEN
jgi:hypothetical protein